MKCSRQFYWVKQNQVYMQLCVCLYLTECVLMFDSDAVSWCVNEERIVIFCWLEQRLMGLVEFVSAQSDTCRRTLQLQLNSFTVIWGTFKLKLVCNVLLRFPGWTTCFLETVYNGVWDTFSLVWWVCHKYQPNQQQHVYKPRCIKETAHTMSPSEVVYKCVRCSSVYTTIEDIRRHVCRDSFIETISTWWCSCLYF